ncbi:crotonobetainyl-CoA:carnitine CoA-transferase CaiB-like acyl-CoA transferase [Panacagrimonas perspica]|uniref:Crotonobetainyl-CoA:carnitine CoA-transferase CaiB-like acyl-CoA transferase n=1 Tax=Panacagrimonas perspica TaxID=381431 RepID=A0A4R7PCI5_9GAMM|nr:CaiB/BaiF CoA-transferase family protein [Panacagrimonas perspica]TDU31738.1 crotonobetainyl-CoA:carnitine CoA-transferase CaiB-like acyl-CoA transferase [Panacagrimonas perspica]THD03050.1 CoA transferase [Panacagrimonas perspica]
MRSDGQGVQALAGIKVLDLSRVLAGPWCTQILGDFGADILKVEPPGSGDDTRTWGPPNLPGEDGQDGVGESAYYLSCNRNKRSAVINLATQEGADLIRRLAAHADVVVENFKAGGLKKYGLAYEDLKRVNPRLVYCSITGFGQSGPNSDRPGYDFIAQAMGGMMSVTGEKDGPPTKPGVAMADLSTGMYAAVSILVALRHAERTGEGQHIDCSLFDTQITMLANQGLSYLVSGASPGRMGNTHPAVVPYQVFDASDGPVVVAVGNNTQFVALCSALGMDGFAQDARFLTNRLRVINREALVDALGDVIRKRTVAELVSTLSGRNVPCGPVNTVAQAFSEPMIAARGTVHHFVREDGVRIPSVSYPGALSRTPSRFSRMPPRLGEHTIEVLEDWLGIGRDEVEALMRSGAVTDRGTA